MTAEIVTLRDSSANTTVDILVSQGFNSFRFFVPGEGDEPLDVFWSLDDFETGDKRPSSSGVPILFPFPGRIRGTELQWQGQTYTLEAGDGRGNAIHGFVHTRPWRLLKHDDSHAVGQFQASVDDSSILDHWPSDFRITATYRLLGTKLEQHYVIENPGEQPLPCGFGTHPYFRVPLGGNSADCIVRLPVSTSWEFVDMVTSGKCESLVDADEFHDGLPFVDMQFDNCFGGLSFNAGKCAADIADAQSQRRVTIRFDDAFRECVVYTPPHREAVCIEPYTCPPDPFRLMEMGVDAGLRVLDPGESFEASVAIEVE